MKTLAYEIQELGRVLSALRADDWLELQVTACKGNATAISNIIGYQEFSITNTNMLHIRLQASDRQEYRLTLDLTQMPYLNTTQFYKYKIQKLLFASNIDRQTSSIIESLIQDIIIETEHVTTEGV